MNENLILNFLFIYDFSNMDISISIIFPLTHLLNIFKMLAERLTGRSNSFNNFAMNSHSYYHH